jgi:putative phosphoesterase
LWMVISDTHDNLEKVKRAVEEARKRNVTTVFHCGDIVAPFVVSLLKEFELHMVFGNNDGEWLFLKEKAGNSIAKGPREIEKNGKKIALMHEPFLLTAIVKSQLYDFVFYGHTHELDIRKDGKTLIVNPGEACGCLSGKATVVFINPKTKEYEVVEI